VNWNCLISTIPSNRLHPSSEDISWTGDLPFCS
jgi:hypothetical protein